MTTNIYIAVYSHPLDSYKFRHTALFFEFADGQKTLMNIEGSLPRRRFYERPNNNPRDSKRLLALCLVASLSGPVNRDSIKTTVSSTPVSQDPELDCHHWVGLALTGLQDHGYITKSQRDAAIDAMTDALLEDSNEG